MNSKFLASNKPITIMVNKALWKQVSNAAIEDGRKMYAILDDALEMWLEERKAIKAAR